MMKLDISLGSMLETLYLKMIPGVEESILDAKNEPMAEAVIYKEGEEW